jgi:hypothetical protein
MKIPIPRRVYLQMKIPRGAIIGRRKGGDPQDEREHFIPCPRCGGMIDCRDLGDVLANEGPRPHPGEKRTKRAAAPPAARKRHVPRRRA